MSLTNQNGFEQKMLTELDPRTQGAMAVETEQNLNELRLTDDTTFNMIRTKSWDLLVKRLDKNLSGNPGKGGRIDDTHLIRVALGTAKLAQDERKVASQGPSKPAQPVNIIALVGGLPLERARGLLVTAIRQMEALGADASEQRAALTDLVGAEDTEKLLAIETTTREEG